MSRVRRRGHAHDGPRGHTPALLGIRRDVPCLAEEGRGCSLLSAAGCASVVRHPTRNETGPVSTQLRAAPVGSWVCERCSASDEMCPDLQKLRAATVGSWVCERGSSVGRHITHATPTHTPRSQRVAFTAAPFSGCDANEREKLRQAVGTRVCGLTCSRTCAARGRARGPAARRPGPGGGRGSLHT